MASRPEVDPLGKRISSAVVPPAIEFPLFNVARIPQLLNPDLRPLYSGFTPDLHPFTPPTPPSLPTHFPSWIHPLYSTFTPPSLQFYSRFTSFRIHTTLLRIYSISNPDLLPVYSSSHSHLRSQSQTHSFYSTFTPSLIRIYSRFTPPLLLLFPLCSPFTSPSWIRPLCSTFTPPYSSFTPSSFHIHTHFTTDLLPLYSHCTLYLLPK